MYIRRCFLHQKKKIISFMSHPNLHKIIDAFISTCLVYFNTVYSGIGRSSLHRLQIVKKAPAGILTGTKKYGRITPANVNLHWSTVIFLIDFKIVLLTFKALNGLAPNHIIVLLTPYVPGHSLRSVAHLCELFQDYSSGLKVTRPLQSETIEIT